MAEKNRQDPAKSEEGTVRVRVPRDRRDQEDKVVWVNERRFVIKRGVEADVPAAVAEVLRHEEEMLLKAGDYERSLAEKHG